MIKLNENYCISEDSILSITKQKDFIQIKLKDGTTLNHQPDNVPLGHEFDRIINEAK